MPPSRTLHKKRPRRTPPPARRVGKATEAETRLLALARELAELPADATFADVVGRLGDARDNRAGVVDQGRPQQRITGPERALGAEAAYPRVPLAAGLHHCDVQLDRASHVARPAAAALQQAIEVRREPGELLRRHVG